MNDQVHGQAFPRTLSARRTYSVLCVDDDPFVSDALSRCLVDDGIRVLRAFDGMQGFWRVLTEKPQAVISDLSMPNGSGVDMIECLRRNASTESLPVIVLTGTLTPQIRRRLLSLNVSAVLHKPVDASAIRRELRRDFFWP